MAQRAANGEEQKLVAAWFPAEVADQLKQVARSQDRTMSAVLRRAVEVAVEDQLRGKAER